MYKHSWMQKILPWKKNSFDSQRAGKVLGWHHHTSGDLTGGTRTTQRECTHVFLDWKTSRITDEARVAFAISNTLVSKLPKLPHGISERLIHLRIPLAKDRYLSMISVYALTMTYANEEKEAFYQALASVVDHVNVADKSLIIGDFNAWVGKDHTTYSDVIGKFGKGNKNSNGELLLNFCT